MSASMIRIVRNMRAAITAVLASAVAPKVQQIPRWRLLTTVTVIAVLIALAVFVPLPSAVQLRDWATSLGPWFPLAFLAAHIIVTVFPFPRTAFTLAAGLLFGSWLGATIAIAASAASALIAALVVRAFGWQLSRLSHYAAVEVVDTRLRQRGWLAVLSLRLIPAVPFSVINYAAGASSVRLVPYTLATVVGLLPGTVAVVILGDAFTGNVSPTLAIISGCTACVGVAGVLYEVRAHRRERGAPPDETAEPPNA